jgi:hypothetical protein
VDKLPGQPDAAPAVEATPPEPIQEMVQEITTTEIEIPLGEVSETEYLLQHVETRLNTDQQKRAFKRVFRALEQRGATLANGRPINRPGNVLQWLMEQV